MTKPRRKRKGKVLIKQRVSLQDKNDSIKSENIDTLKTHPTPTPRSNGVVFKVKIKRK